MITPELLAEILKLGIFTAKAISDALNHDEPVHAVARLGKVLEPVWQLALENAALIAAERKLAGL